MSVRGKVREKCSDLFLAHIFGVSFAVEKNEPLDPIGVCLLGADTVMLNPEVLTDAIEELGR